MKEVEFRSARNSSFFFKEKKRLTCLIYSNLKDKNLTASDVQMKEITLKEEEEEEEDLRKEQHERAVI